MPTRATRRGRPSASQTLTRAQGRAPGSTLLGLAPLRDRLPALRGGPGFKSYLCGRAPSVRDWHGPPRVQPRRLKNCTARSWRSAAAREANVPRLRRLPVRGSFFREYSRYLPELSRRIISGGWGVQKPGHWLSLRGPGRLTRTQTRSPAHEGAEGPSGGEQPQGIPRTGAYVATFIHAVLQASGAA
jgi:hypothetical protein